MSQDGGDPASADVIGRLAENVRELAETAGRLTDLEKREDARDKHATRVFRVLISAVAALAFLLAVAAGGFAYWNHQQDAARSASHLARTEQVAALEQKTTMLAQRNAADDRALCQAVNVTRAAIRAVLPDTPAARTLTVKDDALLAAATVPLKCGLRLPGT